MLNFVTACGGQNGHTALHSDKDFAVSPPRRRGESLTNFGIVALCQKKALSAVLYGTSGAQSIIGICNGRHNAKIGEGPLDFRLRAFLFAPLVPAEST